MGGSDPAVRVEPVAGRHAGAGRLLAASFTDTPNGVLRRLDPDRRFRLLRGVLTAATRDSARHGHALVAVDAGDAGRIIGTLLMMPSTSYPPTVARRARMAPAMVRAAVLAPRVFPAYRRSIALRSATLPPAGRWWLMHTIGVDSRTRRRGVARELLRHGVDLVDRTGWPSYLHTASRAAAELASEFGFVVDGPVVEVSPGGPSYVRMVRPGRD